MNVFYNDKTDLLYIRFDNREQDVINRRVSDDVVLDIGEADKIIGIEIIDASKHIALERLLPVQYKTANAAMQTLPYRHQSVDFFFRIWSAKVPDYGDAIIAALYNETKGTSVATFDRKFRAQLKKLGLSTIDF